MKKRVIITGAGASKSFCPEFGIGSELVEQILQRLTEEHLHPSNRYLTDVIDLFEKEGPENLREIAKLYKTQRKELASHLADYMNKNEWQKTIDSFVSEHNQYLKLVNFCIAFHIAGYEGASREKFNYNESWLFRLCNLLEHICDKSENLGSIEIITFNYDRLIENYIHMYFSERGILEKIENFVQNNIHHVYGSLGSLPWQKSQIMEPVLYGAPNSQRKIMEGASRNFITIYEARIEKEYKDLQEKVFNAEELWILGFGFDEINMNRLNLNAFGGELYLTSYDRKETDRITKILKRKINGYKEGPDSCLALLLSRLNDCNDLPNPWEFNCFDYAKNSPI
jgi:hypothetical protein